MSEAEESIYTERMEHKYFLSPTHARRFIACIAERLEQHRFQGPNANTLPRPVHNITTLYFDSPSREIARACERGDMSVKLRAREYYDEHPELTELATSRAQVIRSAPVLWLEVKTLTGAQTHKSRFSIPTREMSALLARGVISEATLAQGSNWGESAKNVLRELAALCAQTREPLRADCLAHYRRRAWQDPAGELRVTLDTRLAFYRAPPDMFAKVHSLREVIAGPPVEKLSRFVVEIKLRGQQPPWLQQLAREVGLEHAHAGGRPFSKFLAASNAVHRPG